VFDAAHAAKQGQTHQLGPFEVRNGALDGRRALAGPRIGKRGRSGDRKAQNWARCPHRAPQDVPFRLAEGWALMSCGIECPFCRSVATKVVDSRADNDRGAVKRRRECESCGERWTTYEIEEDRLALYEEALKHRA